MSRIFLKGPMRREDSELTWQMVGCCLFMVCQHVREPCTRVLTINPKVDGEKLIEILKLQSMSLRQVLR